MPNDTTDTPPPPENNARRRGALGWLRAAVCESYENAWTTLAENTEVLARKAEVHIDWASNTYRDPAGKRNVDDDPLSLALLRDDAFDYADDFSLKHNVLTMNYCRGHAQRTGGGAAIGLEEPPRHGKSGSPRPTRKSGANSTTSRAG